MAASVPTRGAFRVAFRASNSEVARRMDLRVVLFLLLLVWLLTACGGCAAEPPPPSGASPDVSPLQPFQTGDTPLDITGGTFPPMEPYEPTAQDYLDNGIPLTAMEFGPFDGRIFLTAGKPDFANHHASTVMVSTQGPLAAAQCSGILLTPSLVLTAASCLCEPQKVTPPQGGVTTLFNSSTCSSSAHVTTIVYGEVVNEYIAAMTMRPFMGAVRPHPDFKLVLNEHQAIVTNHADLAVIALNKPVASSIRLVPLSRREPQAQETLVMAGYGYGKEFSQIFGLRFARRDKVLEQAPPGDGRFLYEQQGSFLYNGFKGGPCLHEERGRYELVGVVSFGTPQELSFTSTYAYRDWLDSEIQQATKPIPASRKHP